MCERAGDIEVSESARESTRGTASAAPESRRMEGRDIFLIPIVATATLAVTVTATATVTLHHEIVSILCVNGGVMVSWREKAGDRDWFT